MPSRHAYGGQAVIEGVMIRGQRYFGLAVRRLDGQIATACEPLDPVYSGPLRRYPFLRGVLVLIETLVLGVKALNRSALMVVSKDDEGHEMPRWVVTGTIIVALALGIGLFFITPLFAARSLDRFISSSILSNFVEGLIRLLILLGYIGFMGTIKDIRRVFAYHGAEHMTVHAYEAGLTLDVDNVKRYPPAHPRCGTAFLLVVMVVAIFVFAFLGRPPIVWSILSRVLLIPAIAAISYEIIRLSGIYRHNRLVHVITYPSLMLQRLTTRQPDDQQIEVAIQAMRVAIAADEGQEPAKESEAASAPPPAQSSEPEQRQA